jgi:hypothetical protein
VEAVDPLITAMVAKAMVAKDMTIVIEVKTPLSKTMHFPPPSPSPVARPPNLVQQLIPTLKFSLRPQHTSQLSPWHLEVWDSIGARWTHVFKWNHHGLVVWVSWIDDCLVIGNDEGVTHTKNQLMNRFDCDEVGHMDEYVGCKIDRGDD